MSKKSRQKNKHLENEKSFSDKIFKKIIIFEGVIEANKKIFLEDESPTLIE